MEGGENLKTEIFIMKYDVFILFARADAEFARHVAKGLERINLSVLYNTSLPRPVNINQRPLQNAVVEGIKIQILVFSNSSLFFYEMIDSKIRDGCFYGFFAEQHYLYCQQQGVKFMVFY